jgi:endonuclease III-like uncharacterized protein
MADLTAQDLLEFVRISLLSDYAILPLIRPAPFYNPQSAIPNPQ